MSYDGILHTPFAYYYYYYYYYYFFFSTNGTKSIAKRKTHKLFLIFVIVKPKVINKIKYLPDIGFNFQHADSPHNFQRGANGAKLSRNQTMVSRFFLFFSEPTTQRGQAICEIKIFSLTQGYHITMDFETF
jgi:hypothetical protein